MSSWSLSRLNRLLGISVPRAVTGSGLAFLGSLAFDRLLFSANSRIWRISCLSVGGLCLFSFPTVDQPYLLATIAVPATLVLRERLLAPGGWSLFWGAFLFAKVALDELHYLERRKAAREGQAPIDRNGDWPVDIVSSVHQLASWYLMPRSDWLWRTGVDFLDRHKGGWMSAIGAFISVGIWTLSSYWGPWIKLSHPRLYTTLVHYLRERPLYYVHLARTSLRCHLDRLMFNVVLGKSPCYRYSPLKYYPLKRNKSEIRLLKLQAANSWDIVKADLVTVAISEAPPFEAISYRWASGNEVPILLDKQRFVVSGEVHKLLRTLRYRQKYRLLWLDSVCIDQENDGEKSWQIGFMKEIYSSSEQVIGWIAVMPEIPYLPGPFSSLRKFGALSESPDEFFQLYLHGDLCTQFRASIISLCNEFFFRTWIIQEIALAQNLVLKFDREEITWEDFVKTVKSFLVFHTFYASTANFGARFHSRMGEAMEKIYQMEDFRSARKNSQDGLPLSQLLLGSVDFHVTNPRDRVFGLLGLSTDKARTEVPIRYGTDTTDLMVLITATRFVLSEESSFRLLELGGIGFLPSESPSQFDRPSWTPWWESPVVSVLKTFASTCNKLYKTATWAPVVIASGNYPSSVLQIQGLYIDKIRLLSHPWFALDQVLGANYTTIEEVYRLYSGLHAAIEESFQIAQHAHHPMYNDKDRRSLVWRTICHESRKGQSNEDLQSFEEDAEQVEEGLREVREQLRALLQRGGKATGMDSIEGLHMGSRLARLRHLCPMQRARLCVTDNGYLGTVPAYAKEGDQIWAFLGGPNPFVLRASSDLTESKVTNAYQLVGVCYVDGIMHGELENAGLEPTQVNLI